MGLVHDYNIKMRVLHRVQYVFALGKIQGRDQLGIAPNLILAEFIVVRTFNDLESLAKLVFHLPAPLLPERSGHHD